MAILSPSEMMFTSFEPKQSNRFLMRTAAGIPAFMVKGVGGINVAQGTVALNHMNTQRFVKGKTTWGPISMTLFDPITPSGAQSVIEWLRLHHESVTGRDGYSDFYKKDLKLEVIGPVGDVVSEWIIKGALITSINWGDYNYDDADTAVNIALEVQPDYCVLNF